MDRGPIFIGGLAGSGKTTLRLMLSSHPHIALTRRTYFWTRYYGQYGDLNRPENFERCLANILESKYVQALGPDPDRIRREFWQGQPTYGRLFALFHQHYAERMGKPRWGDQLGEIERFAAPVFGSYPAAKMIHLIRDPRQLYRDIASGRPPRRGRAGWMTARWLHSVKLANQNKQRYGDGYQIVRYETLMSQPERTLRELCIFLGEPYTPAMLAMEDAATFGDADNDPRGTESISNETQAARRSTERDLPLRETAFTQAMTRSDLLALGYPLEMQTMSTRDQVLFRVVDWPINLLGMAAWHTLEGRRGA